jgi:drug/metabolite transporter (DMT)-like permease
VFVYIKQIFFWSLSLSYLLITSLIWAFSFGLIKQYLAGLDSGFVAGMRLGLALAVFAPFLRLKGIKPVAALKLILIGFFQFGFMYVAYLQSFKYLQSFQVALFTIFTPLWVTLVNDLLVKCFHPRFLITAALVVLGTGIITFKGFGGQILLNGFILVQFSNLCFAAGQVAYARVMAGIPDRKDREVFGLAYLGGFLAAGLAALFTVHWQTLTLTSTQFKVLLYLGLLASALGFFLWNLGARKVNAGLLAATNNLKVPLGVACSLLFFGEQTDLLRLFLGGLVIAAAFGLNERWARKA